MARCNLETARIWSLSKSLSKKSMLHQVPRIPLSQPSRKNQSKKGQKEEKKKNKGIDAFLENKEEAKLFAEQPAEEIKTKEKKKKSVGFNLEQNQVLEFDKTKKITEIPPLSQENEGLQKKSIAKENMDDLVNRTNK